MTGNKLTKNRVRNFSAPEIVPVLVDRFLTEEDNGKILRIDEDVELTVTFGLSEGWRCEFMISEDKELTVTPDFDVLVNGNTTPVPRTYSMNPFMVRLQWFSNNAFRLNGSFAL